MTKKIIKKKEKDYVFVAKALNELLGLEPPIDVTNSEEEVTQKILEASDLLEPEDEISEKVQNFLKALKPEGEEKPEEVKKEEETVPEKEVEKPVQMAAEKSVKPENIKKGGGDKEKGFNQSKCIRENLKAKKTDEQIIAELQKGSSKTAGWAKARLLLYYKSYGKRGKNDPKL